MLFFDRRRKMSRVLNQGEFKMNGSPFGSQGSPPARSECGHTSPKQDPSLCHRCSSYACRWFPALTLADWMLLQLVLCAFLVLFMFVIVGVHAYFLTKERFGFDLVLLTRDLYTQARDHYWR
ncbi:hypothetical protein F503_05331 [Ophiostoma piceae UAMH 11346]|uniref:Uncharacterized protein n=1 Tax=Ophiostoma piceae (strain UAMH 11346) TaxID=1262450 RepID=S3CDY5_OPHP1|nr:hypothetical protein F503_05331 [Ophiostoma piceae UAMH 11346]